MSKAPAFQFYANDFMDATRFWDANAVGLYVRCMCIQWTQGGLPADLKALARGLNCDRSELESVWNVVGPKFELGDDGLLRNKRLEAVRERQNEISGKRSKAAHARHDAHANAHANDNAKTMQRKVKVEGEVEQGGEVGTREKAVSEFETLWIIYERHGTKKLALEKWLSLSDADRVAINTVVCDYVKATHTNGTFPSRKYLEGWLTPANRLWERPVLSGAPPSTTARTRTEAPQNQPVTLGQRLRP